MASLLIRRAAMIVALPAFVAGASATPALASDSGYDDDYGKVVHVKICKEVRGDKKHDDYKKHDDRRGKHDEFTMKVETGNYADEAYVTVRDGYCKRVDLKFDEYYKQVYVDEYVPKGYKFVTLKCDDGYYVSYSYDKCDFKKDWVKIVVINKVVKKKHHYDD